MKFYSEYGEDQFLFKLMGMESGIRHRGFYVDVGAMRPDVNSNTAFLRDMGWSGVAIDGHPDCARWWLGEDANLPEGAPVKYIPAILSGEDGVVSFLMREPGHEAESRVVAMASPLCGVGSKVLCAQAVTLQSILHAHCPGEIDFLSIDIEGAEFDVFRTVDLDRHKPKIIVAEYNTLGLGKDYRLMEYLLSTGKYTVVHQTVANLIYVRRES